MASPQDEFSAVCNRQLQLAGQCFQAGIAAAQRMFMVQMDGARELYELHGQPFAAPEAGEAEMLPWLSFYRRAMAGGAEASQVYFRTYSALQVEAAKVLGEFSPEIKRSLEQATRSLLAASAALPEMSFKRAA